MIELIGNLVRNLVVVIFLNALLEMLLPQGQFHRYIRMITGLIVILMVINVIGAMLGRLPESGRSIATAVGPGAVVDVQGEQLWRDNQQRALETYRGALLDSVRQEIERYGGWELIEAGFTLEENPDLAAFGEIYRLEATVRSAGGTGSENSGGSRVEPVLIDPVNVGPGEGEEESAGPDELQRVPGLEQALARRLEISPALITVRSHK